MATPPGRGGISIVRLSGATVPAISQSLIGELPKPRFAKLCDFIGSDGSAIDRGLALYFPAPNSYTGEPTLELHGHGSPVVMTMLAQRCLELGARLAQPGEFSQRAFINGRMDLAQAEAVADLIESSTEAAARSAMHSLQGEFSSRIHELVKELTELRVLVESAIDFPEESVDFSDEFLVDERLVSRLNDLQQRFTQLSDSAQQGKILRDGLKVVLTGPPNAGKSSLLNVLSQQPRAIVSPIPGTTRDVLEQFVELDGLPMEIVDTAGIRSSTDEVEIEGVRRALAEQQQADVILLVIDDATTTEQETEELIANAEGQTNNAESICLVRNKIDVSGRKAEGKNTDEKSVAISALNGDGIADLIRMLKQRAGFRDSEANRFTARQRHVDALQRASQHLQAGIAQLTGQRAGELLAEDLAECQRCLGEITGEVSSDDLLGIIFATFCIGK